jgi:hypothetical protein
MSNWPGNLIRKTPITPAGTFQNGAAPGVWSLSEASYWTKQGLWPTAGNFLAVEDVFSTFLYTGTGAAQTITNGINVSGQGGLVWLKMRSPGSGFSSTQSHALFDTVRGDDKYLCSDLSNGQFTFPNNGITFNSSGFGIDAASFFGGSGDQSTSNFASWTFREAPNFFDVVTYTGTGANRNIAHNLGSVPGMILVKRTDTTSDWQVYHRSNANTQYQVLNTTAAVATGTTRWNSTTPTATEFTVGTDTTVNASGGTYVAYLYAHDTASTGLIQCGSFTTDGSNVVANVTLGWEPQWMMIKRADGTGNWMLYDNMRGMPVGPSGYSRELYPNTSGAEANGFIVAPNATGFSSPYYSAANATYVYIAIRRGPMRTPTLGTSVFAPIARTGTGAAATVTSVGFPPDAVMTRSRNNGTGIAAFGSMTMWDRLRGVSTANSQYMFTNATQEERSISNAVLTLNMNGYSLGTDGSIGTSNYSSNENYINYSFLRAPGFFDEVCYTGTGAARTLNHNLGVAPELIITKSRSNGTLSWNTYAAPLGNSASVRLNTTDAAFGGYWNATSPTSSVFTVGSAQQVNENGSTYVAYLFASCPGVSKVGSYTGNGSSQTINCAFTTGSRFVMIKRTDSTGNWFVWDSARGIVAGNDPYLALNTDTAEVTSNDSVDTDSTGFVVNQVAASNVNVNGATYIFLAIA